MRQTEKRTCFMCKYKAPISKMVVEEDRWESKSYYCKNEMDCEIRQKEITPEQEAEDLAILTAFYLGQ